MRRILFFVLLVLPFVGFATWQVSENAIGVKFKNRYLAAEHGDTTYAAAYKNRFVFYIKKGSLKANVLRNAKKYGYKVVWKVKKNHSVLNNNKIAANDFIRAMNMLIDHYPELTATYTISSKQKIVYVS